jgi:hypothetical protein
MFHFGRNNGIRAEKTDMPAHCQRSAGNRKNF